MSKCEKCLKNEGGYCIAYTEFIGDDCIGFVDKEEDMIKMWRQIYDYNIACGSYETAKVAKWEIERWTKQYMAKKHPEIVKEGNFDDGRIGLFGGTREERKRRKEKTKEVATG